MIKKKLVKLTDTKKKNIILLHLENFDGKPVIIPCTRKRLINSGWKINEYRYIKIARSKNNSMYIYDISDVGNRFMSDGEQLYFPKQITFWTKEAEDAL